jgi:flagellar hook-basal body complex protein FliE
MGLGPIGAVGAGVLGGAPTVGGAATAPAAGGASFGNVIGDAVSSVEKTQANADGLAQLAATGQLEDVHQYTIAAARAQLVTELAVAVRNKAVEGYNEIMRMPL